MIKNIIIGKRSRLSDSLFRKIKNAEVLTAANIDFKKINNIDSKKNIILNNFYPSYKLNRLKPSDYEKFVNQSLLNLANILSNLLINKIDKIIYTSSSSVYNLDPSLSALGLDKYNRKLYATFKFSAEKLIENFCHKKKIKFYIMRLFNTYGDNSDEFSFIEKLIKVKKGNSKLTLINNGVSLRDFIHLDDVSNIYQKFLINNYKSGVYDIGTGEGKLIRNLVEFVNIDKTRILKINNVNEITKSIADINKLKNLIGNYKFKSLEKYLLSKINLVNKKKFVSIANDYQNDKYEGSVIYGAGFAGKELYLKLKKQKEKIIFFVDDDIKKQNSSLESIPIISFRDLVKLNHRKIIDKIYVAIPSLDKIKIKKISQKLRKSFFDVRLLPEKKFLFNNQINLNDIKFDQINSFLNRKPIAMNKIHSLKQYNVLVTGAAGSIGSEICRQLVFHGSNKVIGIDHSEIGIYQKREQISKKAHLILGDLNDNILLTQTIYKYKINLIIHAAAYKHVNILENNIHSAVSNNIFITKNICECALKNNINLVLISTDKAAQPKSILGYTKKVCELLVQNYNLKSKKNYFNIVRFGNVFGSSGSAVTKFIEQINNGKHVTITNKLATRYFMTILEACYLVLKTTSLRLKNKIFILDMGKPINIYQLAKKLGQYKKKLDSNYQIKFIETGLQKNEKLHERLHENKELLCKINQNIFYVSNDKFDYKKFYKLFLDLEKNYKFLSKKKIINCLKSICKI